MKYLLDTDYGFFDGRAKWIWSGEGVWGASPDPRPVQCRYFARHVGIEAGQRLILAISADSKYMLYVTGRLCARGPQKGDVAHQFFDVLDLTDDLTKADNLLLVRVDSFAKSFPYYRHTGPPAGDMSAATVFAADAVILNPDGSVNSRFRTDESWQVRVDPALDFRPDDEMPSYVGFKEIVDFTRLPPAFHHAPDFNDGAWEPATVVHPAFRTDNAPDAYLPHRLLPRSVEPLHQEECGFASVEVIEQGGAKIAQQTDGSVRLQIPAQSRVRCLLDAGRLLTAYPEISFKNGHGSRIRLKYAERLRRGGRRYFGPYRPDCAIQGYSDHITAGNGHELWSPMHWRAFRYIEVSIQTDRAPLEIVSIRARNSHYPILPETPFHCSDTELERFWQVGLRTQQACAHDAYSDCPYYEQLQYAGDTQAQMLFTYATSARTRLPRQAIRFFHWSRLPEGLTQSRYPSRPTQVIPYWSLHYLFMLYDWYMYTGNAGEIRDEILDAVGVLRWFLARRDSSGLIGKLQHWCVADWSPQWCKRFKGLVPGATEGPTALTHFMVIAALEQMSELLSLIGEESAGASFKQTAGALRPKAHEAFWNQAEGVYRDSPLYDVASQLTNAWALLINLPDPPARQRLAEAIDLNKNLCQAALFGQFYVFEAWTRAGRPDLVVKNFESYRELIREGVTTWPETPGPARSECHAWSNAASYHLLRTVLGFRVAKAGCRQMMVAPFLEGLTSASGSFVTPSGPVFLEFDRDRTMPFCLKIPNGIDVVFSYGGRERTCPPGEHRF